MQQSLRRVDQDSSIFTAVLASPAGRRRCSSSSSRATSPERASMRALMSMSKSAGRVLKVTALGCTSTTPSERLPADQKLLYKAACLRSRSSLRISLLD
uniref:Uncharacterized protein n=1 Tax=Trichogramma kaykai TaxID=54128 RepID=A0ABD2WAD8_9HYME